MALKSGETKDLTLRSAVVSVALSGVVLMTAACNSKVATVKAAQAEMQPITRTLSTNGKVELMEDFEARAAAPGEVKQIFVKVGDTVRPGQDLIRLDDADAKLRLENADYAVQVAQNGIANMKAGGNAEENLNTKADMASAQINLQQTQNRLRSLQLLQGTGASSANEISSAQLQVTEAQNRINALRARQSGRFSSGDMATSQEQLTRAYAELGSAKSSLANFDIRTPIAGTVYGVQVVQFGTVNPGQVLVNVADLNKIRVRAFFDEPEIGRLALNQPVRITWEAKPDRAWHGHISQTPTSITNYGTRNVGECLITVDDAKGDLIPNVNVTVYVTTVHKDSVLAIPREALRTDGRTNYVFKIIDGKLQRTPVQVDVVSQTSVQITSGLKPGDTIVQVPMNDVELRDGLPVKVQP